MINSELTAQTYEKLNKFLQLNPIGSYSYYLVRFKDTAWTVLVKLNYIEVVSDVSINIHCRQTNNGYNRVCNLNSVDTQLFNCEYLAKQYAINHGFKYLEMKGDKHDV